MPNPLPPRPLPRGPFDDAQIRVHCEILKLHTHQTAARVRLVDEPVNRRVHAAPLLIEKPGQIAGVA